MFGCNCGDWELGVGVSGGVYLGTLRSWWRGETLIRA